MVTVRPFKGMRPRPDMVSEVASPPYDVLDSNEARQKASGNPHSFLHVIKPEIDLDPSVDPYDTQVYEKGAENLRRLIEGGILVQDSTPCFYIYKLRMGSREQIGLVATVSVEEYNKDIIKKHEHTRPEKEQDRVNLIDHLNAQTGPVFLTYRAKKEINALIDEGMKVEPLYDFTGDYEVQHILSLVDDATLISKIQRAFAGLDALYVADGHHRSAAASRVQQLRKSKNPNHTGLEAYNFFLSVIFPDAQMHILDYNRIVADLGGKSREQFLAEVALHFDITPQGKYRDTSSASGSKAYRPQAPHMFGMYMEGQWYSLAAKQGSFDASDPIARLDVSILQNNLLSPVLAIKDPRTDKRINFIGGIRGLGELEKRVDSGEYAVAFSLFPTSIAQLLSVADAGKVMPPKSTWFEPKLRSGVVVHMLD